MLFQGILVLEKTLESPLDCKEIKPVHPKRNQCWIFIGKINAEAEVPILWPADAKSWLIGKTMMLGKIEGRKRRGWQKMRWLDDVTDSMDLVWAHLESWWWIGSLECCSPCCKESDTTECLNWTEFWYRLVPRVLGSFVDLFIQLPHASQVSVCTHPVLVAPFLEPRHSE